MKVLVLGATGLLGNAMFRVLSEARPGLVFGTVRDPGAREAFSEELDDGLVVVRDLEDPREMAALLDRVQPGVVVNCTSLSKPSAQDLMRLVSVFSVLPRRLAYLCRSRGVRLVQISSDGIFSGARGGYSEDDLPDANDAYGIAKVLGEVDAPDAITLRTSIIGPEIGSKNGLLAWFLSQTEQSRCYTRAVFSGLPSVVLAQVIGDHILPRPDLHGIYHVAAQPITKFDLLTLMAQKYGKNIRLVPDDSVVIDRSLSADRFMRATGYVPPEWPELVERMRSYTFGLKEN